MDSSSEPPLLSYVPSCLQILDVSSNRLTHFPKESAEKCTSMKVLRARDNAWLSPPPDVMAAGIEAVRLYNETGATPAREPPFAGT